MSRHAAPGAVDGAAPPSDVGAEKCVLGGMLLSAEAVADVADRGLRPEDHYRPAHQMIHAAIIALHDRGEPAGAVSVAAELARRGEIDRAGGAPYLHTLIESVPVAANAGYYAGIVADKARRRELIEQGRRLVQAAADPGTDLSVALALAGHGTAAPASRLDELRRALIDSDGLDELPAPEPLIDGILFRDSLAWLHAKPGHGKSLLALDMASCIAAGLPWVKRAVSSGAVLYVIAEGASGMRARVRAWEDRAGMASPVTFLPIAVQMLTPADAAAVATIAAEMKAVLVVLDTQARVSAGADENSAMDMGRLVDAAESIRQACRACVLFVHHEARGGENMRGSTALEGAATTILRVVKDGPRLELTNPKQKDCAEADPLTLWVVPHQQSVVIADRPDSPTLDLTAASEKTVMSTLLDLFGTTGASSTKLQEATGLPKSTFHYALNRLVKMGKVQNIGSATRTLYVPAQDALPTEVQQVQQGPSPTGPTSNAPTTGRGVGRSDIGPSESVAS